MTIIKVERYVNDKIFSIWKICFTDKQVEEFRQEQARLTNDVFDFTEYSPDDFLELSMSDVSTMRIHDYQRIMHHIS